MAFRRHYAKLGALSLTAIWVLFAASCGGGAGATQSGRSADDASESSAADDEGESEGSSEEEDAAGSSARRINCDDGTCSPCGEGLCPAGWYCDESAQGGPACGWLPECANKLSCSCITRTLSACSCEEKGGGVHLSCK